VRGATRYRIVLAEPARLEQASDVQRSPSSLQSVPSATAACWQTPAIQPSTVQPLPSPAHMVPSATDSPLPIGSLPRPGRTFIRRCGRRFPSHARSAGLAGCSAVRLRGLS
jgi:hypothetical protein